MPVARPETSDARVIAHVDMDCFYVQVEQRKQPELRGLPTAVVQYNEWQGGALIAVSYEARSCGVKRSMRGEEAKAACPEIQLVQVPVARGKADLNTYRSAGSEVVSILAQSGKCERASIDEVYLDLTDAAESMLADAPPESLESIDEEALKSHILGMSREDGDDFKESVRDWICRKDADRRDKLLGCGIIIVAELRKQVLKETEFSCSAGIAHNKMLAKLASGMNKPAQQTVVPYAAVQELLSSLPIKKMKQLGGKLGTSLQTDLGIDTVGDLLQFSETKLQEHYGINTGTWLWNIARGISGEEVQGRLLPKSHGSGKTFPGPRALRSLSNVQHWLNQLSEELYERLSSDLEQNKRIASTLTLHASAFRNTARNKLIFDDKTAQPLEIATKGLAAALEWDLAQSTDQLKRNQVFPQAPSRRQIPGIQSYPSCFVDAAWDASSIRAGIAWHFTNDLGTNSPPGSQIIDNVASPLMAESLALRQGIKEALSLGKKSVSFHSDCATLIRAISTQSQIKEIYGVLQDIKHLSANFDRIQFLHISRSQNREADYLAKVALKAHPFPSCFVMG